MYAVVTNTEIVKGIERRHYTIGDRSYEINPYTTYTVVASDHVEIPKMSTITIKRGAKTLVKAEHCATAHESSTIRNLIRQIGAATNADDAPVFPTDGDPEE